MTALSSPIFMGHNDFLEPTLNLMMRNNTGPHSSQTKLCFQQKINMGHNFYFMKNEYVFRVFIDIQGDYN